MKKIFIITITFFISTFSIAQNYIFDFSINYVSLSMDDFNSYLEILKKAYYTDYFQILDSVNLNQNTYNPTRYEGNNFSNGAMFLVNFSRKISKNFFLGPGFGYIFSSSFIKSHLGGIENGGGYSVDLWINSESYLYSYMISLIYTKTINNKLNFCSNISLGYGVGGLKYEFKKFETNKPSEYEKNLYTGFAPVGNINFSFDYKIADDIGLGINLGYLLGNISEIKSTKTLQVAQNKFVSEGDKFKNLEGKNVSLNFSGITFGILMKHRF
jgi:hypothetical protein